MPLEPIILDRLSRLIAHKHQLHFSCAPCGRRHEPVNLPGVLQRHGDLTITSANAGWGGLTRGAM